MACFHPMHAFQIGVHEATGKPKYQLESQFTEWIRHPEANDIIIKDYIELPCGQCIGCRLDYSKQWANRCMLEAKQYQHNYVLTLTYAPEYLPINTLCDKESGEITEVGTLMPKHLQKFMKDLRRYYDYHYNYKSDMKYNETLKIWEGTNAGIRFYACGEYGDLSERPHYHVICFNTPIYDLVPFFKNELGDQIYLSDTIEKIWGKGNISVMELTWNSAAYVARYVMKKQKGPDAEDYYKSKGIEPEFVRMSRSPGIARFYYDEHKDDIYKNDEMIILQKGKPQKVKPAKYYDRLFDLEEPEKLQALKEIRKMIAEEKMKQELQKTDLDKNEYLAVKEATTKEKIKSLKRKLKNL